MPLPSRETKTSRCRAAALVLVLLAGAAHAETECPARGLVSVEVKIGSADGRLGTIASTSEFDASGKHGRDIFPLAGPEEFYLACRYRGGKAAATRIPPGTRQCEFDYHYINDYDTRPDRVFCR